MMGRFVVPCLHRGEWRIQGRIIVQQRSIMDTLPEILEALQEMVQKPKACCAILSTGGFFDESSLMGTKDGYLNLAIALLQMVAACEKQTAEPTEIDRLEDQRAYWSDALKQVHHQLPGNHTYIVGCYLFDDHQAFLAALQKEVDPTLDGGAKLRNDPSFKET
jgi:hypothetical protein